MPSITPRLFRTTPRYGLRAARTNPSFLDTSLLETNFLVPLLPYRERIEVLVFEFGTFSKRDFSVPERFFEALDAFLRELPQGYRYSVEIRNEDYLRPEYFDILKLHGVAHTFNAWTRTPPLHRQIANPLAFTAGYTVVRALLRTARPYEEAVKLFSPYSETKDPNPLARAALREFIDRARRKHEPAYLFVNNRLEGNAPVTIDAVVNDSD